MDDLLPYMPGEFGSTEFPAHPLPPEGPGGMIQGPPKDQADLAQRKADWAQVLVAALERPEVRQGMMEMGLRMMMPYNKRYQTQGGHVAQAALHGLNRYGTAKKETEESRRKDAMLELVTKKTEADVARGEAQTRNEAFARELAYEKAPGEKALTAAKTEEQLTQADLNRRLPTQPAGSKPSAEVTYAKRLADKFGLDPEESYRIATLVLEAAKTNPAGAKLKFKTELAKFGIVLQPEQMREAEAMLDEHLDELKVQQDPYSYLPPIKYDGSTDPRNLDPNRRYSYNGRVFTVQELLGQR